MITDSNRQPESCRLFIKNRSTAMTKRIEFKTELLIIGHGIAGCLAASYFRMMDPLIVTQSTEMNLSNNRLFRVTDERIPMLLGCKYKSVDVESAVWSSDKGFSDRPTIKQANEYSIKTSGRITKRSIADIGHKSRIVFTDTDRKLPISVQEKRIHSGYSLESVQDHRAIFVAAGKAKKGSTKATLPTIEVEYKHAISTIPMTSLLTAVRHEELSELMWEANREEWFPKGITVSNLFIDLPVDDSLHQTIYFPDSKMSAYRASLMGNMISIETMLNDENKEKFNEFATSIEEDFIASLFGIGERIERLSLIERYDIENGKITPLDAATRKKILFTITASEGIWSLGRFATWSNIRTDDLIKDLSRISSMIEDNTNSLYDMSKE